MRWEFILIGTLAVVLSVCGQQSVAAPKFRPRQPVPNFKHQSAVPALEVATFTSLSPSPLPSASFQALLDNGQYVPPDTMGAVGPNHIVTMLNSQVRIQTKQGAILSTADLNSFWASLGNPDCYDPHVKYDPFNNRWIVSAAAEIGRAHV